MAESFGPAPWIHTSLDPCLFSNTSSSALAGALTLPSQSTGSSRDNDNHATSVQSTLSFTTDTHASRPVSLESDSPALDNFDAAVPTSSLVPSSSLPPRFCSVKGCKATVPGDYSYKMCESCRDRYRGYGTTKRAKWKHERAAANESLEKARQDEDKRRAEAGLPVSATHTLRRGSYLSVLVAASGRFDS
jgi:hypothetical protein